MSEETERRKLLADIAKRRAILFKELSFLIKDTNRVYAASKKKSISIDKLYNIRTSLNNVIDHQKIELGIYFAATKYKRKR